MYRTDKQFMKNPATNASRVYVGNLPITTIADDLEAKFKVHGKILGLILHNGFAFIQFENEPEAQKAIECEHGSMLHGQKINVKRAAERRQGPQGPGGMNQQGPRPPMMNNQMQRPPFTPRNQGPNKPMMNFTPGPRGPQHTQQTKQEPHIEEKPAEVMINEPSPIKPLMQQQLPPPQQQEPKIGPQIPQQFQQNKNMDDWENTDNRDNRGGRPQWDNKGNNFDNNNKNQRKRGNRGGRNKQQQFRDEPPFHGGNIPPVDNFNVPPGQFQQKPLGFPGVIERRDEKNDCEIIVVSKALTEYAEFVEDRLKQLNLMVDLLFPNEDVPIGKVLANISSRGCLYAILVMPQNEEHRSLTLNILHGVPQEHRNMPIEDALILISRNFEAYMRGDNMPTDNSGEMQLNDKHPLPMQMALNLLAENRQLTTSQYDKLITYLQNRRDLQYQFEVAEGIEQDSQESTTKQAELQSRIMNILNKSNDSTIPLSITGDKPQAPSSTPILKDPTVQKALDSFLGDMLKNMSE